MEKNEIEEYILRYLSDKYCDDNFHIINIQNATSPGSDIRSYTSKISSEKYPQRDFYLNLDQNKESIKITRDAYPILLLSESYLDRMRTIFKDSNHLFFDVILGDLNKDIPNLNSKAHAESYLSNNGNIEWVDLIGVYTDKYDDTEKMLQEIKPIVQALNDIYTGGHKIVIHFYPKSLQSENLEFQSNNDVSRKAPVREKLIADWTSKWRKSQLEASNGNLDSFIEDRKVIKQWRSSSN